MDRSLFRLGRHGALRGLAFGALASLGFAAPAAHDGDGTKRAAGATARQRAVDLVICLDTSGSMDGLIDAARQKIWSIVNDLALAQPTPKLRLALLTYGNDGHDAERGWVALDSPFTEDLDAVSAQLFALKTNGGTEYVARVLDAAAARLAWSEEKDALKLIVVAGNESAEQDPKLNFRDVCKNLVEHGVLVDSIYCGNPADEIAPAWREVAQRADGQFAAIDQQNGTVTIATPFDSELAGLSASINDTYLWFGTAGSAACENQKAQDQNASGANSATCAARAMTKGGAAYVNRNDLVDAVKAGTVKIEDVKKEELPEKMREMTPEQKSKCIADAGTRRAEIAKKIQVTGSKRDAYVADEMKKQAKDDQNSFDRAVRDAVRKQAAARGFQFPEEPKKEAPKSELPRKVE